MNIAPRLIGSRRPTEGLRQETADFANRRDLKKQQGRLAQYFRVPKIGRVRKRY